MTADDPDQPHSAHRPSLAPSVAGDLETIFAADAAARPPASASRVRAVSGKRSRLPIATFGAVAAAGLVGLTAGTAMVAVHGKATPAPAPAPAAPERVLAVQVAE